MLYRKTRAAVAALAAAALLSVGASQSFAQAGWPYPWLLTRPTVTTAAYTPALAYAPAYTTQRVSLWPTAATTTVCDPCATSCVDPCAAQTCYYTPEVRNRWSFSRIAYTTYQPVTTYDACTGCPTTAYQPVTRKTLLPWLHREPVTSYRLTCMPVSPCVTTACDPCGTVFSVGGSSCPSGCVPSTTTTPMPGPSTDPGYPSGSTFKSDAGDVTPSLQNGSGQPSTDYQLRPVPDDDNPESTQAPSLIRPSGRTAARPVQVATYYKPVALSSPAAQPALDTSGWRASR